MNKIKYREQPEKFAHVMAVNRIKCKCGHVLELPHKVDKSICTWCGNYVFKNKKIEFEYRMKERFNNEKQRI